jgi:enamine deaminase RidA (YjgF/YER057c/UK114 family)
LRALAPSSIEPPFARYSHGIAVPAGHRLVFTSGQLGIRADQTIPSDCEAQADLCFANIAAILAEDDMTLANVVRLNAYVTDREHMQGYMRSRDRQFQGTPPASTLMIVKGFTKPEFLVEIEVVAAAPEHDWSGDPEFPGERGEGMLSASKSR